MRDATWRVGRKVKRTVYIGDDLVGLMDTPELADEVVRAVNNRRMVESAGRDIRADRDRLRSELARERETNADIRAGWDKALSIAEEAMSERNLARAERDQFKAERDKAYHDYKLVRAENADLCQKERALLDTTLSALVAARMFGAGNESGWQTEVETAIDQVSARLASLGEKPCSAVPETQGWNADGQLKCELPGNHNGPHQCRGGVFKWDKAYVPPPAESQPVQVREEAAQDDGVDWERLADWERELLHGDPEVNGLVASSSYARGSVHSDEHPGLHAAVINVLRGQHASQAGVTGLSPFSKLPDRIQRQWLETAMAVVAAVRRSDRESPDEAREVLKQLVDAIEDDHAGDMSPLWAEAKRVLGETK